MNQNSQQDYKQDYKFINTEIHERLIVNYQNQMNYYPPPYPHYYPDYHHFYSYYPPPPMPYPIEQWYQYPQEILPAQTPLKAEQSVQKNQSQTFKDDKSLKEPSIQDQEYQQISQEIEEEEIMKKKKKKKVEKTEKGQKKQKNAKKDLQKENLDEQEIERRKKQLNFLANLKKNTESNIVNQIFSYIGCKVKSGQCVHALFNNDVFKIKSFYDFIKTIKKRKKKYINRKFLLDLCILDEKTHAGYKLFLREKGYRNSLTRDELKSVLRRLFVFYLNSECILSIATSKKLSPEAWQEHLYRRRQILQYLEDNIKQIENGKLE